ncbi:MAG: addiction module protein [Sandaracinaceae bacterium]|nr:addiction module protein [Sandaracinaceae bacterium]
MTDAAKKLMEDALALPAEDRKRIGVALLDSVAEEGLGEGDDDIELSEEWSQEIARRIERLRSGESKTVPWSEVEARIKKSLSRL